MALGAGSWEVLSHVLCRGGTLVAVGRSFSNSWIRPSARAHHDASRVALRETYEKAPSNIVSSPGPHREADMATEDQTSRGVYYATKAHPGFWLRFLIDCIDLSIVLSLCGALLALYVLLKPFYATKRWDLDRRLAADLVRILCNAQALQGGNNRV